MKSIILKLLIIGFLAAGVLTFCPQVASMVYRTFNPPPVRPLTRVLPPPGIRYLERVEDLVFELTNQARQARGLAPLIKDTELREVARAYSNDMLVRRFFDHTSPDGISFDDRIANQYRHWVYIIGENIFSAFGYNPNNSRYLAKEIMDTWMKSPGHRENLLSPGFTHLGVGVSARHDKVRATQEFVGRPKGFRFGSNF